MRREENRKNEICMINLENNITINEIEKIQ